MQPSLGSESSGIIPSSLGSFPSPEHMLLVEEGGNQPFGPLANESLGGFLDLLNEKGEEEEEIVRWFV
jgi:hypothetical protein